MRKLALTVRTKYEMSSFSKTHKIKRSHDSDHAPSWWLIILNLGLAMINSCTKFTDVPIIGNANQNL